MLKAIISVIFAYYEEFKIQFKYCHRFDRKNLFYNCQNKLSNLFIIINCFYLMRIIIKCLSLLIIKYILEC